MRRANKIAFLFPGQGAQYSGMGKDFAAQYAVARQTFEEADDLLQYNLSKLAFGGSDSDLKMTRFCQPAIFVNSIAILRVVQKQFPQVACFVTAGLSLGEYSALTAGGYLPFADSLLLVKERAALMDAACEERKGGMSAVLGLDAAAVEEVVAEVGMPNDLWVGNFNSPDQVAISGTERGLAAGAKLALVKGATKVIPLQVHGAFHSGLMAGAADRLAVHINKLPLRQGGCHIVMNATGEFAGEIDTLRSNLIRQVTSPVRWQQSVQKMVESGVDLYIEMGPGKTLAGMNKRIKGASPTISLGTVKDLSKSSFFC